MPGVPYTGQKSALNLIPIKFLKIPHTRFIPIEYEIKRPPNTWSSLVCSNLDTYTILSCVQNLEVVT